MQKPTITANVPMSPVIDGPDHAGLLFRRVPSKGDETAHIFRNIMRPLALTVTLA